MKKFKKIILWFLSSIFLIFLIITFVFFRKDISQVQLEDKYFTEYSHYIDVEILSLDEEPLIIQMHYQDYGQENEEVIVLLHGAFSSSHTFMPWAISLVEEGYRIIIPDLPYFGLTDGFSDNLTSYRRNSEAIKNLLDKIEIETAHFAGNSLGGATAWYFAGSYPNQVLSLNLIDAVYPSTSNDNRNFEFFRDKDLLANFFSNFTPRFLMKRILKTAYGNPDGFDDATLTRYYDLLRKEGTRQAILQSKFEVINQAESLLENVKDFEIPVLIMWGKLDTWISVEITNSFKETLELSDSDIIIYETLGHVPMEEAPETTLSDYLNFLRALE